MKGSSTTRTARCPICRDAVVESTAPPFCSERCRTVDLGNWLGEAYKIPVLDDSPVADESPTTDDE